MSTPFEFSSNAPTDYAGTEGDFFSPHPSPPSTVASSDGSSGTYKTADGGTNSSQHHPRYPPNFSASLIPHLVEVSDVFQQFPGFFQGPVRNNQDNDHPFLNNVDLSMLPPLPRHLTVSDGLNSLDFPASQVPAPQPNAQASYNQTSLPPFPASQETQVSAPQPNAQTSHDQTSLSLAQLNSNNSLVNPFLPPVQPQAPHPLPSSNDHLMSNYNIRHDQDLFLPETDPVPDPDPEDLPTRPSEFVEDPGNEGDTESLPVFSTRRRRHTHVPTYTGDALVSLDDIRMDEATPRNRKNGGKSAHSARLTRRRPPYKLRLSYLVREELASLTGMKKGVTLVGVCQALSNNELNAFATLWKANAFHHLHSDCCDIKNFFIDLVNTPRSPWNQSASRVFTVHFVKAYKLSQSPNMMNIVREAFFTRIKTLRADLKRLNAGRDAIALSRQSTRRWLRKQTLFNNRLAVSEHPLLRRYRPILLQLGVAGMSTDESDQETTNQGQNVVKIFRILVPIWRTAGLTPPLRWMDKMYLFIRKTTGSLRGALPRIRIAPDIQTETTIRAQAHNPLIAARARFVNNLPKCAYDIVWFGICASEMFRFDLRYTNEDHDFTVTLELLAYFEKYLSANGVNLHPGTLHARLAFPPIPT